MKLLGSTENKITKDKNGENVPHLEITEVVLVHCNIVNNDYQQDARVLYTFVPNKPFGSLLGISPTNHIFLKTFNSEYDKIIVWFTDQNSQPIEIEDGMNLTIKIVCIKIIYSKKSTTDAIKTASKKAIQKTAEATDDLIGNKIADKITSVSKKKPDKELPNNNNEKDMEITTRKKDTYLEKKDSKLLMN